MPTKSVCRYTPLKIWLFWVKKIFSKNFNFFEIFFEKIENFMMFYGAHKFLVKKIWDFFSQISSKFQKNLKKLIFWQSIKTVLVNRFSPTYARTQRLYHGFSRKSFIKLTQQINIVFGWKSSLNGKTSYHSWFYLVFREKVSFESLKKFKLKKKIWRFF